MTRLLAAIAGDTGADLTTLEPQLILRSSVARRSPQPR
jgi:hypothetical protein